MIHLGKRVEMWKLVLIRSANVLHHIQKSNITWAASKGLKAGTVKTLSIAFFNIVHYGSRFTALQNKGMGIHAKDCQIKW